VQKNSNGETGEYPVQPGFCGVFSPDVTKMPVSALLPRTRDPSAGWARPELAGPRPPGFPSPVGSGALSSGENCPKFRGPPAVPVPPEELGRRGARRQFCKASSFSPFIVFFCCCFLFYYYYFPLIVAPSFSSPLCHERGKTGWKWAFPGGGKEG